MGPNDDDALPGTHSSGERKRDKAKRLARGLAAAGNYPHGVHPALIPGVSVDDQRFRYTTDRVVFGTVACTILAFFAWGVADTESLTSVSSAALVWVTTNFGWLMNALAAVLLIYMLLLGFTKYGKIPLGLDGEKPEFSTFSWIAMLFAAGMGIGLLFFGPYEPMQYYLNPPPGTFDAETNEAMHRALIQTVFHWGPQAWAMYALVGAAVAYGAYRRGRTIQMSSIFATMLGTRGTDGVAGRTIDIFAIIATLFGTAASLGIGALQIGRGVELAAGVGPLGNAALIGIVAVLTAAFIISAVSGVAKGIRYLSNINMVLAIGMAFFVFIVGPTLFLLNFIPSVISGYMEHTLEMISYSASYGEKEAAFLQAWTTFYWAWWVSWSPFVGIFIAKISRGRTLRQFVTVVILVPSLVCLTSFSIYGGTSMYFQSNGRADVGGADSAQDSLFILLDALPLSAITSVLVLFMLTVFFVTSADSASIVMGSLVQRGRPEPAAPAVITMGLFLSLIAIVMLLIGGEDALQGMQNLIIVSALPFTVAMIVMMWAFYRDLRNDPLIIRDRYADHALTAAVRMGVREYGDDFTFATVEAPEGFGAGADFDSYASNVTEWYQRRDEDGDPIEYDYEQGQYINTEGDDFHSTPSGRTVEAEDGVRGEDEDED